MFASFEEKGKVFTNVVTKKPVDVLVQTSVHLIRGKAFIRPDDRLVDELNRETTFIPITEAVITDFDGNEIRRTNFIAVNRNQIIWLIPLEEINNKNEDG